ncbi:MAG TPA: chorismate mutase [Stellaceae bacterium]|nr:chorismate mutase [Stellaceae bacterium]
MAPHPSDLEDLRRRIDEIDDRLQDLLIERGGIVLDVASRKRAGSVAFHQPAREAEIIRRLLQRHRGEFPTGALVRIWREMIGAMVRLEGPFAVAVYAPPEAQGYWDLARDHYGSHAPMSGYATTGQVIRAMADGHAAVGVLPMPQQSDPDPWWWHLLSQDADALRVIARLPFGPRGNARRDVGDALAIGHGVQQPTGRDRTLIATENALGISRHRMFDTLKGLDLQCTLLAAYEYPERGYHLIELEGFVPITDPRLERFRLRLGEALHRLLPFGGYAVPPPEPQVVRGAGETERRAAEAKG